MSSSRLRPQCERKVQVNGRENIHLEKEDWQKLHLHIASYNNFSTAAGLACLVYSLAKLMNLKEDNSQLSAIARQGSGSARRSLYGGFVKWDMASSMKLDIVGPSRPFPKGVNGRWKLLHMLYCHWCHNCKFVIVVMYPIQKRTYRNVIDNLLVLLIGGIPIGMPTVLSVTVAIGSHKLSKQGAITKRMTAIEEMAGMDVLCSDKTGTLTLNKLTVDKTLIEV